MEKLKEEFISKFTIEGKNTSLACAINGDTLWDWITNNLIENRVSWQKPFCVTTVLRSGGDSDYEWSKIKNEKMQEHLSKTRKSNIERCTIELEPYRGDRIAFECSFMDYGDGLRDPAGYKIVSRELSH